MQAVNQQGTIIMRKPKQYYVNGQPKGKNDPVRKPLHPIRVIKSSGEKYDIPRKTAN